MARQVDVDLVVVCVAPALLRLGQALSVLSSLDAKNSSVQVFETLMGVVAEYERCVRATGASVDRVPDRVRAVTKWAAAEVCAFAKDLGGALQKAHADTLKEHEGKAADKALADPEALYEPGQEKQAQLACQGDLVQTLRKRFQAAEAAQTALGELEGRCKAGDGRDGCIVHAAVVAAFTAAEQPFRAGEGIMELCGRRMGSFTALQVLVRDLAPGENRVALARRLLKGLGASRYLRVDAKLHLAVQKLAGTST